MLERSQRGDRSRVIVAVISGNANQMSNARIVSAANGLEFSKSLARFARVDERACGRDGIVDLTLGRRWRLCSCR